MKRIVKKRVEKGRKFENILGINVISSSTSSLLAGIKKNLSHNVHFYIVTPNPELVLMSQKNPDLKNALNGSEFPVPDGIGLSYASKFLFGKSLNIIPGRKLFTELVKLADKNKWKIFLLGGMSGEADLAASKLRINNSKLKIEAFGGPVLNKNAQPGSEVDKKLEKAAIERINKFIPDLLFVAFGNPKQEIWIHDNMGKLRIGGAMAVGGTLRYEAGLSKLPPRWMETIGLEWLWRVLTEPGRIGRIWNAVFVFPLRVIGSRFSSAEA